MANNKTILAVIGLQSFPNNEPIQEILFAKYLPGFDIDVVILQQVENEQRQKFSTRKENAVIQPLSALPVHHAFGRVLNRLTKPFKIIRYVKNLRAEENNLVIHIIDDWLTGLVLHRYTQRRSIPLIFQYSRPGYEFYFLRAKSRSNMLLHAFDVLSGRLEQSGVAKLMTVSEHILPISNWMRSALEEKGIPSAKMTSVPMGFDPDALNKVKDARTVRNQLGLGNRPIAVYFGTMLPGRDLEFLLRAFHGVIKVNESAVLLMIGGEHADIQRLKKYADELGLAGNILFTGFVPRKKIYDYLAAADLSLSPIPPVPAFEISSPTKLVEALGMGCPVVASDIPEQRMIINESGGGFCIPYNEETFTEKILELFSDRALASAMGQSGQRYILKKRNYRQMAKTLSDLYKQFAIQV
jgi:glycosyltransferase involved in cell wall biosynthesis